MARESDGGGAKAKCGKCKKECKAKEKAMECDFCNVWFHIECGEIPEKVYEFYGGNDMDKLGFLWKCDECKLKKGDQKIESEIKKTNKALLQVQEEIIKMKKAMQENGKSLQEEIKKAKPSFAEIVGNSNNEKNKKAMDKFAACVVNTQKKICDDREDRKNNVIIFNLEEEGKEKADDLNKKVEELFESMEFDKKSVKVERIGKDIDRKDRNRKYARPVKVNFNNSWDKRLFMSKLKNLKDQERWANTRVSHDMGMEDREESRRLLKEAYELNLINKDKRVVFRVRGPPWAMEIVKIQKN